MATSTIHINPIISDTIDDNKLIRYSFDVPTIDFSTSGTSGQYPTNLYGTNSLILQSYESLDNIIEYFSVDDTISGDVSYFNIIKKFRYSIDDINYSLWEDLNITNLKDIGANIKIYIQFYYGVEPSNQNYDLVIPIKMSEFDGWFNAYTANSNNPYLFSVDYPNDGSLVWKMGYGTDGMVHLDTNTSKLYQKENGIWTGGVLVVRGFGSSGQYTPTMFNGNILSDAFMDSIVSKYPIVPINDYTLLDDIKFGKTIETALPSSIYRPQKGDTMFINPLFQGIVMVGKEEIFATYTKPVLPIGYNPSVYVKDLSIVVKQWVETISTEPLFCLNNIGDSVIFKPPMTLKMYSIDDLKVEVDGICSTSWNVCLDIKFRYSYNSRRWDTNWMPLTLANLTCIRPNPLKFFYIEFLFTKICDNNGKPICVSDLVIGGNVQNVSNDYDKLNRFGIRSDSDYGVSDINQSDDCDTNTTNTIIPHDWFPSGGCEDNSGTLNIYNLQQPVALYEKLANDVSNLFGWVVDYYRVEANDGGTDVVLHEYGTYDTIAKESVKILVPDNKFPEDQISFNNFDMSLLDSFEIHITKKEFYRAFGVGLRPGNNDYLFLSQVNKWYTVSHAQSFRDFMNTSVYFKLSLSKKQDDTTIDNGSYTDSFNDMIVNNQVDNLFGIETREDINHIVNAQELQNLTEIDAIDTKFKYDDDVIILANKGADMDAITDYVRPNPIMTNVMVNSIESDLENATNVIARYYYDLSSRIGESAINYQYVDDEICDCCNRAFMVWFNLYQYQAGMVYNIIDNFNTSINNGYKIDFVDGRLIINWFGQIFNADVHISANKWYGLVINFIQNEKKIDIYIYKRKTEHNCSTTDLDIVNEISLDFNPVSFKGELKLKVNGSYLYWTNMRLFSEAIPKDKIQLVLNQYIVKNSEYLLVSDNGDKKINSNHFKY